MIIFSRVLATIELALMSYRLGCSFDRFVFQHEELQGKLGPRCYRSPGFYGLLLILFRACRMLPVGKLFCLLRSGTQSRPAPGGKGRIQCFLYLQLRLVRRLCRPLECKLKLQNRRSCECLPLYLIFFN